MLNEKHFNKLEIKNFKSCQNTVLEDCKRINILIGPPNVGKSNILESLILMSNPSSFFKEIRNKNHWDLFYDTDLSKIIEVNSDSINISLRFDQIKNIYLYNAIGLKLSGFLKAENLVAYQSSSSPNHGWRDAHEMYPVDKFGNIILTSKSILLKSYDFNSIGNTFFDVVKRYIFKDTSNIEMPFTDCLRPPHGENLFSIVDTNKRIESAFADLVAQNGHMLVLKRNTRTFEVQKIENNRAVSWDVSMISQTLLRYIFHLAAIYTNRNSIIAFEEPEAHSYPPYVSMIAEKIVESETNQFFVATHSPYFFGKIIEKCKPSELSIYSIDFRNFETVATKLTEEQIDQIKYIDEDVFLNMDKYNK